MKRYKVKLKLKVVLQVYNFLLNVGFPTSPWAVSFSCGCELWLFFIEGAALKDFNCKVMK